MRFRALIILAAGLLLAADKAKDDDAKKELDKLQGSWTIVTMEREGKADPMAKDNKATVTGDKFSTKSGKDVVREGALKIDPGKTPKAIDVTYASGPFKGQTLQGIYELDNDTWKICYAGPGKERPKAFPGKDASAYLLFVFKRDKP